MSNKTNEGVNQNAKKIDASKVVNIIRELIRDAQRVDVEIEQVKTTIINGEGEPEDIYYTESNPLNMYEGGLQKVYLSQCYSKNYPFYVNVIFEQTQ